MTVEKDVSSSVFEGQWKLCRGDVRRQVIPESRLEVQPRRRLDRRLFSVWSAGRPVCDSTQIGVALTWGIVNCPLQSLARYSGAVLLRQRNTRTARRNAIRSGMRSQCRSRSGGVTWSYFRPLHTSLAAALNTDCRRSCKRRDIPMRFTRP